MTVEKLFGFLCIHIEVFIFLWYNLHMQAIKGMRNIFGSKITIVPIKEMTDVLSVESKNVDITRDTWVRMKIGTYKGDLAKVCIFGSLSLTYILFYWQLIELLLFAL